MVTARGRPRPSSWPPVVLLLLLSSPAALQARPLLVHSSINVAVVFSGSSYQNEVRGRLSGENFVDLPVVVSPVTVLVNDTNPRDLLTHLCDTMATEKLHGVVFEDDVGSGAGDQVNSELFHVLNKVSPPESPCPAPRIQVITLHTKLFPREHLGSPQSFLKILS